MLVIVVTISMPSRPRVRQCSTASTRSPVASATSWNSTVTACQGRADVLEGLPDPFPANPSPSATRPGWVETHDGGIDLSRRVEVLNGVRIVAPVERLVKRPHDLHILLRNTRSPSLRGCGFHR